MSTSRPCRVRGARRQGLRIALASLLPLILLAGCALDADRAGDGPLYYRCDDDGQCAAGFRCAPAVARLEGETVGLCLPTAALGDAPLDPDSGCGSFLESRAPGLAAADRAARACLLPFSCPSDGAAGELLPGDHTGCPLGFVCIAGDEGEPCAACGFASCNMTDYAAPSATLTGLVEGSGAGCLERGVSARSPFEGTEAGRVYCRLRPSSDDRFTSCPAGWVEAALPEKCGPADGTFCALVTGVADGTWPEGQDSALRAGTNRRMADPVAPLMLAPAGSLVTCRPSP